MCVFGSTWLAPKLEAFTDTTDQWLQDDQSRPKKQRHTAKRTFERPPRRRRITGGYTTVRDYVRGHRLKVTGDIYTTCASAERVTSRPLSVKLAIWNGFSSSSFSFLENRRPQNTVLFRGADHCPWGDHCHHPTDTNDNRKR